MRQGGWGDAERPQGHREPGASKGKEQRSQGLLCVASGARRHWDSGENSGEGMGRGLSFCIIISF